MRFVELEKVKIGDVVAVPVKDYDGRLLIGSGKMLTDRMYGHLESIGITGIYICDDAPNDDSYLHEVIPMALKAAVVKNLKKLNIDLALHNAREIVNNLVNNPDCNEYINQKTFDNYTYEHSVSVAIYATLVGIEAGFRHEELVNLAYAGLLHDLGKMCISTEILNKPGRLTYDEYEEMKRHPEYGYNLLKDNHSISATIKTAVFEHHENEDGSGYPRHLKSDSIYKFAKIIHIVDVYDAVVSKRPYKKAQSPQEAIAYLQEHEGEFFDGKYLNMFLNIVPAYPRDILIELSNGEEAVVVKNYHGFALRPLVRTSSGEMIDLAFDEKYKDVYIL